LVDSGTAARAAIGEIAAIHSLPAEASADGNSAGGDTVAVIMFF